MKIIDYGVIDATNPQDLRNKVKTYLDSGWEPQGGVAVSQNPMSGTIYAQAIVRVERP